MAFVIDQRAAGVAGIDRRVRLDEVFHLLDSEASAARRAHDSSRYGLADAERIADRQYDVADLDLARIGQRQHREVRSVDLEHRDVRARIGTNDASLELPFVVQRDGDFAGAVHHVIVRQDIAFRADDDARTKSLLGPLLLGRVLGRVKLLTKVIAKLLKELIDARWQFQRCLLHDFRG